jgi:hypothetical protein
LLGKIRRERLVPMPGVTLDAVTPFDEFGTASFENGFLLV